ncbi:MAG: acetate--CoA ligase family protein [Phycisphaerales bacterium]
MPTRPEPDRPRPLASEPRADAPEAIERILTSVQAEGRSQLLEHEVYEILRLAKVADPPRHVLLTPSTTDLEAAVGLIRTPRVVLKIVSAELVHKTDAQGVAFCENRPDDLRRAIDGMLATHRDRGSDLVGVLAVECVEHQQGELGSELYVGLRVTREFGPVLAAGLGGTDAEYIAGVLRGGKALARAPTADLRGEQFLDLFSRTSAYALISGQVRGHRRRIDDDVLCRCFDAWIALANAFGTHRAGPELVELEVNPFAVADGRLVPLDGRGRLGQSAVPLPRRPIEKVHRLLEPRAIAILGVSSRADSFGRIILRNVSACGFDLAHTHVIKPGAVEIDRVPCVPSIEQLPETVDLLVIAAGAEQLPAIVDECVDSGKVHAAVIIPGGAGETEGSDTILARVRASIARGRGRPDGGCVFVGPNCLGIQSRPGKYDTFFIPDDKLDKRRSRPARGVALVSQSGAFIVSRMSRMGTLDPALAISIGNQADLTVSDFVRAVCQRTDIHTIGVYVEGFSDLDGLELTRVVRDAHRAGQCVVFYKAGRTEQGRSAAAGHTASLAGDYDVCEAALTQAGVLVAESFAEFEQLLELSAQLHAHPVRGLRLGAVSNAGFEAVGIADRVRGEGYELTLSTLEPSTVDRLRDVLEEHSLAHLVNARNPLDLTPMADESAYEAAAEVLLGSDQVDALILSAVPLTPALATTARELDGRRTLADVLAALMASSDKPIVAVIDSGRDYDPLAARLRETGAPVFRSADDAVRALGRYLCHRTGMRPPGGHLE